MKLLIMFLVFQNMACDTFLTGLPITIAKSGSFTSFLITTFNFHNIIINQLIRRMDHVKQERKEKAMNGKRRGTSTEFRCKLHVFEFCFSGFFCLSLGCHVCFILFNATFFFSSQKFRFLLSEEILIFQSSFNLILESFTSRHN